MKKLLCLLFVGILVAGCGSPKEAKKTMKEKPTARQADAQRLIEQGKKYIKEGDVLNAIQTFDEVVKRDPKSTEGYMILGETYLRLRSYDRAIDTFTAGLATDPNDARINYLLAVSYSLHGNKEEAIGYAQRSVELFQDNEDQENFIKAVALLQSIARSN